MRILGAFITAVAVLVMPTLGKAEEYVISQKGKEFSPSVVEAKVGDVLRVINDDGVSHTVHSQTSGFKFRYDKQNVGDEDVVNLDKAGQFEIGCLIHPRMKLTVVVSE